MLIKKIVKALIPKPVKRMLWGKTKTKYDSELAYWQGRLEAEEGTFRNAHYKRLMLAMAEEPDETFLQGKIVADFGCGPRGSLVWAASAHLRIGIDVLADRYAEAFKDNMISHDMIYVKSTEQVIPLPSDFVDILFTVNAIDHVDNFSAMCKEIIRVLKPGGQFIGSFNLEEPPSPCEPQQLNEKIIQEHLLNVLDVQSYRTAQKSEKQGQYTPFFEGKLSYQPGQQGYLWVKAKKKISTQ